MMQRLLIDLQNRFVHARSAASQRGAALAEYGLLLALVALAAIGVLTLFGDSIADAFTEAQTTIENRGVDTPAPDPSGT